MSLATRSLRVLLLAGCLFTAGVGGSIPPAAAQMDSREAIDLQHQIQELKRDIQTLRDQRGGQSGLPAPTRLSPDASGSSEITAQLLSRVANLEEQMRRLRGRVDEVANQTQRLDDDVNKKIGDLNFRIQSIEGGGQGSPPPRAPVPVAPAPGPAQSALPLPTAAPGAAAVRRTPEIALQEGSAALARRDYTAAEAAAREVLNNNKTSPRVYDAQFLLAQSLSGRKEYSQAAIAYDDAYKRNRKGARAPDALLGLANSLNAIGERRAACDTVTQLRGEFPNPKPDLKDQIAAANQRAGCK
jgi:TolA-binding protein